MTVSAWCHEAPGITSHKAQHKVCQQRQTDGLLPECSCRMYDGHTPPEKGDDA